MNDHTSFGLIVVFQSQFLDVWFNVDEVQVCFICDRTTYSSCHKNVLVLVAGARGDFTIGKLYLYGRKNMLIVPRQHSIAPVGNH